MDPHELPVLDAEHLRGHLTEQQGTWVAVDFKADGRRLRLCDFASAGEGGAPYISWLKAKNAVVRPFSREAPLRSSRTKKPKI
jgi:hypothetical protein